VEITLGSWPVPPIFELLQEQGGVPQDEMYRAFNMGIGFVIIAAPAEAAKTMKMLKTAKTRAYQIGRVVKGKRRVVLT